MALCEMCGKEAYLVEAEVEGGELKICSNCVKFGVVKKKIVAPVYSTYNKSVRTVQEFKTVNNYSRLIRFAREEIGLKQEDFAKFLNEKESVVAKWESGVMKPSIEVARRLERVLNVKLVESESNDSYEPEKKKESIGFTLGDFIKVRKRR